MADQVRATNQTVQLKTQASQYPHDPRYPCSDPRPDLVEDWLRWELLLYVAYKEDKPPHMLFWFLHGLRTGGARLIVARTAGGEQWKLNYKPALEDFPPAEVVFWEKRLFACKDVLLAWLKRAKEMEGKMNERREVKVG